MADPQGSQPVDLTKLPSGTAPTLQAKDRYYAPIQYQWTEYIPLEQLRYHCDVYCNPRSSGWCGPRTFFNVKKEYVKRNEDMAKLCLKRFNEKISRNFALDEIVKLNNFETAYYLTFKARDAETGDAFYFRGVVRPSRPDEGDVLLCEIKDDGPVELEIPDGHDDYYDPMAPENCDDIESPFDSDDYLSNGSGDDKMDRGSAHIGSADDVNRSS